MPPWHGRGCTPSCLTERFMSPKNLPMIDARYWTAILAASMCGANTGDFVSRILGLGHTRGLLPLALIFLAIVCAERRTNVSTKPFFLLPIILLPSFPL